MTAIVGAAVLHAVLPLRLPLAASMRRVLGVSALASGIGLAAWAVSAAGDADVESDSALVTNGPFALTRNPMYLGWSAGVLGLALGTGSGWLLATWVLAVRALDREVDVEEANLLKRFGRPYAGYRARVPRWLPGLVGRRAVRPTSGC